MVEMLALELPDWSDLDRYRDLLLAWGVHRWINILLVLLLAFVLLRAIRLAAQKMKSVARSRFPGDRQAELRAETMTQILQGVGRMAVLVITGKAWNH